MRFYLFLLNILFLFTSCIASAESTKPIYELPPAETPVVERETLSSGSMIAGAKSGLYRLTMSRTAIPLWTEGSVSKIIRVTEKNEEGTDLNRWYFLTSMGILTSTDLETFELRNNGLPVLKMKEINGEEISFSNKVAQLKDLEIHPENNKILITATKDRVYVTYDGGLNWNSISSMSVSTSGIKAVAICSIKNELVALMAHPIFGFSYSILEEGKKNSWVDVNTGFEALRTQVYPDEIADIIPVVTEDSEGAPFTEIYVSQTFIPRLYKFDWNSKSAVLLYKGKEPADTVDGLFWDGREILFTRPGEIAAFNPQTLSLGNIPKSYYEWRNSFSALAPGDTLNAAWIPQGSDFSEGISLSELWLLKPEQCDNVYADKALEKRAIYCPANHVTTQAGIDKYKKIILDNKLNSLVIDMKDDYGLLRYETKDPLVLEKCFVSRYHIDLDSFVSEFKKDNIYLIARIVVFKDKHLSQISGGKYAVWDWRNNKAWVGTKGMEDIKDEETGEVTGQRMTYYDENWVDPYSPEVWEYNVRIAKELIERGFDEIQFDYIRFPTDGRNMADAQFRWRDGGMDKESALLSFLAYVRKNIDAPIGIDIYGANGWYRSGTRTGQDVEQLAEYVDVICPMFYPSHFEQDFLEYTPVSERPYRIYFFGTYRNTVIGRNKIIIRPWVQAFYLNVRYDRQWYNSDYVQKQIYGVRDSVNRGYMYWNNIGRYDDISPDVGNSEYKGPAQEASREFRKPALSRKNLFYPETLPEFQYMENSGVTGEFRIPDVAGKSKSTAKNSEPANLQKMSAKNSVNSSSLNIETNTGKTESIEKKQIFPSFSDIKKLWQPY